MVCGWDLGSRYTFSSWFCGLVGRGLSIMGYLPSIYTAQPVRWLAHVYIKVLLVVRTTYFPIRFFSLPLPKLRTAALSQSQYSALQGCRAFINIENRSRFSAGETARGLLARTDVDWFDRWLCCACSYDMWLCQQRFATTNHTK